MTDLDTTAAGPASNLEKSVTPAKPPSPVMGFAEQSWLQYINNLMNLIEKTREALTSGGVESESTVVALKAARLQMMPVAPVTATTPP